MFSPRRQDAKILGKIEHVILLLCVWHLCVLARKYRFLWFYIVLCHSKVRGIKRGYQHYWPRRLSDLGLIYCGKVIFARFLDHFR